jgi:hypothetical protein
MTIIRLLEILNRLAKNDPTALVRVSFNGQETPILGYTVEPDGGILLMTERKDSDDQTAAFLDRD